MKKPMKQTLGDFLAGRGFYIVLFLCVAAVGVSGWYLMRELTIPGQVEPVNNPVQVTVPSTAAPTATTTPAPTAEAPSVPPRMTATPAPTAPAPASATPAPSAAPTLWGSQVYTWPVKGEVLGVFSLEVLAYDDTMGDWRVHEGMDIAAEVGTAVKAVTAGTVSAVYADDLMGTVVVLEHGDGLVSSYANLAAQPTVAVGDGVDTGAVLGAVGQTAIAEVAKPAHLHFEMTKDGAPVDPVLYLPAQ